MKLLKLGICLIICFTMFTSCGQDKYDEVIEYNNQFVEITQKYIDGLNSATSAEEVAKAMNDYSSSFAELMPKMKKINEEYSELLNQNDLPEKVKQSQEEAAKVGVEFASSFMKTMKYMMDPEVAEAQKEMGRIMKSMNQ